MAHRSNVVQVPHNFDTQSSEIQQQKETDPVCNQPISTKDCKHLLFQGEKVIYFCSKTCKSKFMG